MLDAVLGREMDAGFFAHPGPALDDDLPINEYFWFRHFLAYRRSLRGKP
jgi:hypothetical protein